MFRLWTIVNEPLNYPPTSGREIVCVTWKGRCVMSWSQRAGKGSDEGFEKAPPGNHPAVLVGMIDMGTQVSEFNGQAKAEHRAYFVYELVQEKNAAGKSHIIAIDLNLTLNEYKGSKSKLRKFIEARTGKQISDGSDYDILQELGQPVLLNVVMKGDFPKIDAVGSVPKGMSVPAPTNTPFAMVLDNFRQGGKIPEIVPWLYGEPLSAHINRCLEITGKEPPAKAKRPAPPTASVGSGQSAPPPSNRPAPPSAPGRPAPPSASSNGVKVWLDFGDGTGTDSPVSLAEAAHVLLAKGLNESAMACAEGTTTWKPAREFGVALPI